ncbi:MAG: hypothetical protein IJY39_07645 [Clostridia bacterium]|nr:hypothetical protein [Clostridia bacterium]
MKITRITRTVTTLALLAITALSVCTSMRAKESYEEMKKECTALKERLSDMRITVNNLTEQIKTHRAQLDLALDVTKECLSQGDREAEVESDGASDDKVFYTVREYKEAVGIFDAQGKLLREENIPVSSLPADDRQSLEIGIRVDSEEELERLLEDLR